MITNDYFSIDCFMFCSSLNRAGWSGGKVLNFYWRAVRFESLSRHLLFWPGILVFFLSRCRQMPVRYVPLLGHYCFFSSPLQFITWRAVVDWYIFPYWGHHFQSNIRHDIDSLLSTIPTESCLCISLLFLSKWKDIYLTCDEYHATGCQSCFLRYKHVWASCELMNYS